MLHRHADFTSGAHKPEPDEPVRRQLCGKKAIHFCFTTPLPNSPDRGVVRGVSKRYAVPT